MAIEWLLDHEADPAIRWQAMRDLTEASPQTIAAERRRIAHEGLGARILAHQVDDGWHREGKPTWLPTLYTLQLLRMTGADPADGAIAAAIARLESGYQWHEEFRDKDGKSFFDGETEPCINGEILSIGAYFGRPNAELSERLLKDQLEDGGWNCDAPASRVSSYHSTICVLEGLLNYERATKPGPRIVEARRRGENYLLERALFRRRSTGEIAAPELLAFAFPPRYKYDVLRALEYFRSAGAPADPRMHEALEVVRNRRRADGTWLLDATNDDSLAFAFDERVGEPSRWNTLRALRVLDWYDEPVQEAELDASA